MENGEEKISQLNSQIEELNITIDENYEGIKALKDKFKEIQELSGNAALSYEEKRVECEQLRQEVEKLNLDAAQTGTKLEMLKEQNSGFLQQYRENEEKARQLREEKTTLDDALDAIKSKNASDAAKLNDISAKVKVITAEYRRKQKAT